MNHVANFFYIMTRQSRYLPMVYVRTACVRFAALATFTALLGGCEMGPNFVRPAQPEIATYTTRKATPNLVPGAGELSQRLVINQEIPAAWWHLFRSPLLDDVVRQTIAHSPTIEVAQARLAQMKQAVLQAQGTYYPQIDVATSAERQKGPPIALGIRPSHDLPLFNLYSVGSIVSYDPDVFGRIRRQVELYQAQVETQAYQLAAAQLTVTGNAVAEAITLASVRLQIDVVNDIVADDAKYLALMQQKLVVGKIARTEVLIAENRLAGDRALLPPLRQLLAAAEDALAILVGKFPAEWEPPAFALADFTLPGDLPISTPSALVRQRPDILATEAQLHAASAAIGVADAQMYPDFTLSASAGMAALSTSALTEGSNLVWTQAAGLTAPIFHGGALAAQKQGAVDAFHASLATYRQTVLEAFGQVADILRALGHDASMVEAERRALDASGAMLELQRIKLRRRKDGRAWPAQLRAQLPSGAPWPCSGRSPTLP